MSFYINNNNPNRPGPICGNPLNGICEKILIETTKVFDACICTGTETGVILQVSNFMPANPVLPLTFISAENTPNTDAVVSDLVIDRLDTCPNYANVSFTVTIPVTVTYRDANGTVGTATSTVVVQKSAILFVPQPAQTPVNIAVTASLVSQIGTFSPPNVFTTTCCIRIIIKVVSVVDILVPSYGYPQLPPCKNIPSANVCPGFRDLPVYPTTSEATNIPIV